MEKLPKVEQPKEVAKLIQEEAKPTIMTTIKQEVKQELKSEINVRQEAFNLITRFEWFHSTPYWDSVRWAYWYWQPAPSKNSTITKEDSEKFVYENIDKWIIQYWLKEYPQWVQVALLSFRYNLWHLPSWTKRYLDRNDLKGLANQMQKYIYSEWEILNWLVKRRKAETNYFYNN